MPIPEGFLSSLQPMHLSAYIATLKSEKPSKEGQIWKIGNDIRPIDLYCYLWARFGAPNGIQTLLRKDDSDNLIHWDWTLLCDYGWLTFMGMNFRTEIHLAGCFPFTETEKDDLISEIKADFASHGKGISEVRRKLEKWVEFVNPYQRIKGAVDQLLGDLRALALNPETDAVNHPSTIDGTTTVDEWNNLARRYSTGLGLCFGIRAMLPVMAESFVNMLLFTLMKPQIRDDARLREHTFREQIDVRIKSLNLKCNGFKTDVDYTSEACGNYHSFVNERNDLLHGNVVIEKLGFNDIYFNGTVPVFQEYRSMWERSLGIHTCAVGLDKVEHEVEIVERFIEYVLSCLEDSVRAEIENILSQTELGYRKETQRLGILFPNYLVDWRTTSS